MVLLSFMGGLISGIFSSFLRGLLLQVSMNGGLQLVSTYIYGAIVIVGATIQLILVNHAMEVYNQADIGPIYSSSLILLNMLCGGVILDEKSLYSDIQIALLLTYSMVCISGIYLIHICDGVSSLK
jgi:hypothetical protein